MTDASGAKDILNSNYTNLNFDITYLDQTLTALSVPLGTQYAVQEAIQMTLSIQISGILTDLGQNTSNIFAHPSLLMQFLQRYNGYHMVSGIPVRHLASLTNVHQSSDSVSLRLGPTHPRPLSI